MRIEIPWVHLTMYPRLLIGDGFTVLRSPPRLLNSLENHIIPRRNGVALGIYSFTYVPSVSRWLYHTNARFSLGMNILSVDLMPKASYQVSIIGRAAITRRRAGE